MMQKHTRFQAGPFWGTWTAESSPYYDDRYREVRSTLRVALELGRWRVFAAGTWWKFRPLL